MRKKLILSILALVIVCGFAISLVTPAIASWFNQSVATFTANTATATFTTSIAGVATNAAETPLSLNNGNGYSYSGTNIASYTPPSVAGNPNNPSAVTVNTGGFVSGTWAVFAITITNTGSATLALKGDTYTVTDSIGGTTVYDTQTQYGTITLSAGEFGQDTQATDIAYLSNTSPNGVLISPYDATPWAASWFADNSWNAVGYPGYNSALTEMPLYLTTGQSFVWNMFIGLGNSAPYGIGAFSTTVTINLPVAS